MNGDPEIEPELTASERALGEQLQAARQVPGAAFRGALSRHLTDQDPGYGPRPIRLRVTVSGYLAVGGALLVLGLLQATGTL